MTNAQLKAYLQHIKLPQNLEPNTLETLKKLQAHHVANIPFECLNPLLKIPVSLDINDLFTKIVVEKRGGYCFELNLILKEVLKKLGFSVRAALGRVHVANNPHIGRTHLVLLVDVEGKTLLVDVGFGGLGSNQPLLLYSDEIQKTSMEAYRLTRDENEDITVNIASKNRLKKLYTFDLRMYEKGDFEVANWYTSTNSASSFTNFLMCSRIETNERYALLNNKLSIYSKHGHVEKKTLTSISEIKEALKNLFFIQLDKLIELDDTLERMI
jgi:N-hydroxyarylamine O-acetyltransferase